MPVPNTEIRKLGGANSAVRVRRTELSHYIATHQVAREKVA